MRPLSKKQQETFNYVTNYIEKYKKPPTYKMIKEEFKIDASAAHGRCKYFRHLMKRNGENKKMTESEFIEYFKNKGFELYKTEDLSEKLKFYYEYSKSN